MFKSASFSRRDFIKVAGLGFGALAFRPGLSLGRSVQSAQFPVGDRLGRVAVTPNFYSTALMSQPNENSTRIRDVAQDQVVVWQREVVGSSVSGRTNTRWVETPEGFIYAVDLQPVRNVPNTPITAIPAGKSGFWVEVTVPYVDLQMQNAPISPGVKYTLETNQPLRLYYGQVIWADQVGGDGAGNVLYRVNEAPQHGYGYGDVFVADATAFKVLTDQDVAPINPNIDPNSKKITVDATSTQQTLSCYEGNSEVYFCRVSTGYGDKYSTPVGDQAIAWKIFSIHMAANTGSDSGYDTMAVPWPIFFNTNAGAAIHGAFWHNDFGVRRSHGCVNVSPEDAKWIFRWTMPSVALDQSEWRGTWPDVGGGFSTSVTVDETKA
ncbi:MAG TPA: L,D-transpeptidase [Anaerolineales bacterium]|nr:L,D-transpeptidase [Anaerolineales bacterium]